MDVWVGAGQEEELVTVTRGVATSPPPGPVSGSVLGLTYVVELSCGVALETASVVALAELVVPCLVTNKAFNKPAEVGVEVVCVGKRDAGDAADDDDNDDNDDNEDDA